MRVTTACRSRVRPDISSSALAPDGLIWLAPSGLAHPEAQRTTTALPFIFAIGRVATSSGERSVREIQLVLAALGENSASALRAGLARYARFVLATAPTQAARLSGRVVANWQAQEALS